MVKVCNYFSIPSSYVYTTVLQDMVSAFDKTLVSKLLLKLEHCLDNSSSDSLPTASAVDGCVCPVILLHAVTMQTGILLIRWN